MEREETRYEQMGSLYYEGNKRILLNKAQSTACGETTETRLSNLQEGPSKEDFSSIRIS